MSATAVPSTPADQVLAALARSGFYLDHEVLDEYLAEIADKAAGSLVKNRWKQDFPIAAYATSLPRWPRCVTSSGSTRRALQSKSWPYDSLRSPPAPLRHEQTGDRPRR